MSHPSTTSVLPRPVDVDSSENNNQLELSGVIGFNGSVPRGLLLHPLDQHIIYPLGSTIVVKHLINNSQYFLQKNGHDRAVSCLALSATGKYLASGQITTHIGFSAPVIIWNLETYEIVHKLVLHKGKIQDLAFSPNEKYLASLGGRDDNKIVIWDVASGDAICGAVAANESCLTVKFFNNNDLMLVSGGHYNLRVWNLDLSNRKIRPSDCALGQLKRVIHSITIDENDSMMYCGTGTGDLLQVSLTHNLFKNSGPQKKSPFQMGITATMKTNKGNIIVGSGDGTIALIKADTLTIVRKAKVSGGISSLVLNAAGDHMFVGTISCNIYLVKLDTFEMELRNTCHNTRINDIAFPVNYSELFATCSINDIRVWNSRTRAELLRIQVPNLTCLCVAFMPDGKSIVSGWDDGKIRAFRPQSGKLIYAINDAHIGGVTALACTTDGRRIISGGEGGQVRVWAVETAVQKMIASMKEHKARVNSIQINADDTECVSASSDGSCIVWSLTRFVRNSCLFASTQFRSIVYHPDQSQLLTTGTDRKLTYWDVVDGNPIRVLDGSAIDALNTLAISSDGETFVCGGGDKLVKVWAYDEGFCYYKGIGHSGEITRTQIAPDQQQIVSTGEEGAIFIWKMPYVPRAENTETNTQQQHQQSSYQPQQSTQLDGTINETIQNLGKLQVSEEKEQGPSASRRSTGPGVTSSKAQTSSSTSKTSNTATKSKLGSSAVRPAKR